MAVVTYHLTSAGAGTKDGTSLANAWSPAEYVSSSVGGGNHAGTIKAALDSGNQVLVNVYSDANADGTTADLNFSGSGLITTARASTTQWDTGQYVVRGCYQTPGDLDEMTARDDWRVNGVPADVLARMPRMVIASGNQFGSNTISGAVWQNLRVEGSHTTAALFRAASTSHVIDRCYIVNSGAGGWCISFDSGGMLVQSSVHATAGSGSPSSGLIAGGVDDLVVDGNRLQVGQCPAALTNVANSETVFHNNVVYGATGSTKQGVTLSNFGVLYVESNLFVGLTSCIVHSGTGTTGERGLYIARNIAMNLTATTGVLYNGSGSPAYPPTSRRYNYRHWASGNAVADAVDADILEVGATTLLTLGAASYFPDIANNNFRQASTVPWNRASIQIGPFKNNAGRQRWYSRRLDSR